MKLCGSLKMHAARAAATNTAAPGPLPAGIVVKNVDRIIMERKTDSSLKVCKITFAAVKLERFESF